ncbi:unnamed protein product [Rhizoctonia solani]|nr:unnamed protein product [Rhizoctonia solani]
MHRVSCRIAGCPRLWTRDPILLQAQRQMSGATEGSGSSDPRRGPSDTQESGPRKKSRKSAIMEALRRGASQNDGTLGPSRQMSTVASVSHSRYRSPQYATRPKSPTSIAKSSVSSTGLPFYTHTESLDSSSLPALSTSRVEYIRDMDQANYAVGQLIDRMEPLHGSRWRGVVGFDMEWTVRMGPQRKTGLIQVSDASTVLLIQISSMESFPHKLKELITSAIILKVGVNIGGDMKKLCRDFGPSYAARGVLDLSQLARAVDVGLVGTTMEDLDSSRASLGVGVSKNLDSTQVDNLLDTNMEDELSDEENAQASIENDSAKPTKKEGTNEIVRSGRKVISFARLVRRYLGRELEKGDVRTSNWETRLSGEQKQYAANDAHAGLALYYALRKVHSLAISKGVIPVPSPPPWGSDLHLNTTMELPPSGPRPAPPPFRARITSYKATPTQEFVPVSELQDLTPVQLESLIPWDSLIQDLQAEFEEARAAVLVKRKKEGVDLKGRGEAVVAAEETAAVVKLADTPSLAHTSNSNSIAAGRKVVPNPLGNAYYDSPQPGSVYPRRNGIMHVGGRRQAQPDKQSEALGKKWPPTRSFPTRSTESLSHAPPLTTPSLSKPVSEAEPADSDVEVEPQLPESTHSPLPTRSVNSPTVSSGARSSPQHLRAYLLWHKQQLPLAQICASLRSARYPLANSTVMQVF